MSSPLYLRFGEQRKNLLGVHQHKWSTNWYVHTKAVIYGKEIWKVQELLKITN